MQKIIRTQQPDWFKNTKTSRKKLIDELLKITNNHCSYTDKKIDNSIAEIDAFKPQSKYPQLAEEWNNLFVVEPYTSRIKSDKYKEELLNPSDADYDFDRYFTIDFENALILPNPICNKADRERAIVTIEILGLNNSFLVQDRKNVLEQYLFLYNLLKEKSEQEGKIFNLHEYKELEINNYSYRFLIERALKHVHEEQNEYIFEIEIKKYFGIKDFLISDLGDKKEIYFLGENGDGKTLVLQAILLALRGLNEKFLYKYLNENVTKDFAVNILDISGNKYSYNQLITNINKNSFAYGASRLRHNQNDLDNGGFLSLFDSNSHLINPVQWLKDIQRKELLNIGHLKLKNAIQLLAELLENKVEIKLTSEGEFIFDEHGTKVSFNQLSEGYRSTLIWLCDLISRFSNNQPSTTDFKEFKGIVLVDEIGVFLHPKWEFTIVKKLRETFPKIQWIFTTHSPIIILGASKDAIIYRLYKKDGLTQSSNPYSIKTFSNKTISGFVTSPLFNLQREFSAAYEPNMYDLQTGNYVYDLIHEEVKKRMDEKPIQETEIKDLIKSMLENFEKTGKI